MSIILSIETSTKACSAAIHQDGNLLSVSELYNEKSSSGMLTTLIEHVAKTASLTLKEVDAIAVAKGPGSYTGLRIGVSAAKGLCYALNIPLIAVDTLQVLASQAKVTEGLIVPMLDARRMEVYSAIFNAKLEKQRDVQAEIITENSFENSSETIYFVGDCAEKCKAVLTQPNFVFLEEVKYPSAKEMSALSFSKFQNSDFEDVAYFEPYYLKDFMITTSKKVG